MRSHAVFNLPPFVLSAVPLGVTMSVRCYCVQPKSVTKLEERRHRSGRFRTDLPLCHHPRRTADAFSDLHLHQKVCFRHRAELRGAFCLGLSDSDSLSPQCTKLCFVFACVSPLLMASVHCLGCQAGYYLTCFEGALMHITDTDHGISAAREDAAEAAGTACFRPLRCYLANA